MEIHIAEPLVPKPRTFEIEIFIAKFEKAQLIQARDESLRSEFRKLINSAWKK
jgi:acetyl/propionyl-CoA carboxylase alpha subunit